MSTETNLMYVSEETEAVLYLIFIVLLWELDVDVMLRADVSNNGTLAANDFGVILGVHSDGQLEAPECLRRISGALD